MTIETLTIAGAFDEDDDIFARPPRAVAREQAKVGRITCRVCDRAATVPLDWPALLCQECMEDLDATRERVAGWLGSALQRLDTNQAAWDAIRINNERWQPIQAALIAVAEKRATPQALAATWTKRKAEGGALAALLIAYEGYAETADRIGEELNKLTAAQREINQAFLATEL